MGGEGFVRFEQRKQQPGKWLAELQAHPLFGRQTCRSSGAATSALLSAPPFDSVSDSACDSRSKTVDDEDDDEDGSAVAQILYIVLFSSGFGGQK